MARVISCATMHAGFLILHTDPCLLSLCVLSPPPPHHSSSTLSLPSYYHASTGQRTRICPLSFIRTAIRLRATF